LHQINLQWYRTQIWTVPILPYLTLLNLKLQHIQSTLSHGVNITSQCKCMESQPPLTLHTWLQYSGRKFSSTHNIFKQSYQHGDYRLCGKCSGYVHLCLQTAMPRAQILISAATVILAFCDIGMWKLCLSSVFYNCFFYFPACYFNCLSHILQSIYLI
jgi:hypothetical protein